MREERSQLAGDKVIDEPYTLWGSIAGNVTATKGSKFYHRGTIYGNLIVLHGGRVHVYGKITGDLIVKDGAKVVHSGYVAGDAVNEGGRLYVDSIAKVDGQIISADGADTTLEHQDRVVQQRKVNDDD